MHWNLKIVFIITLFQALWLALECNYILNKISNQKSFEIHSFFICPSRYSIISSFSLSKSTGTCSYGTAVFLRLECIPGAAMPIAGLPACCQLARQCMVVLPLEE